MKEARLKNLRAVDSSWKRQNYGKDNRLAIAQGLSLEVLTEIIRVFWGVVELFSILGLVVVT